MFKDFNVSWNSISKVAYSKLVTFNSMPC